MKMRPFVTAKVVVALFAVGSAPAFAYTVGEDSNTCFTERNSSKREGPCKKVKTEILGKLEEAKKTLDSSYAKRICEDKLVYSRLYETSKTACAAVSEINAEKLIKTLSEDELQQKCQTGSSETKKEHCAAFIRLVDRKLEKAIKAKDRSYPKKICALKMDVWRTHYLVRDKACNVEDFIKAAELYAAGNKEEVFKRCDGTKEIRSRDRKRPYCNAKVLFGRVKFDEMLKKKDLLGLRKNCRAMHPNTDYVCALEKRLNAQIAADAVRAVLESKSCDNIYGRYAKETKDLIIAGYVRSQIERKLGEKMIRCGSYNEMFEKFALGGGGFAELMTFAKSIGKDPGKIIQKFLNSKKRELNNAATDIVQYLAKQGKAGCERYAGGLRDETWTAVNAFMAYFGEVKCTGVGKKVKRFLSSKDQHLRKRACHTLAAMKFTAGKPGVRKLSKTDSYRVEVGYRKWKYPVRESCAQALAGF